ncbi:hypothetical protein ACTFIR_001932 [Dictyostelium discoideum]
MCNENLGKDPYLFFNCKKTLEFIQPHRLKNFIFITTCREYFEWNYKCVNYDLSRTFAYRNIIALILHNIWVWICNQLYIDDPNRDEKLDANRQMAQISYSRIHKKKVYCISESALPNIISFDQFI